MTNDQQPEVEYDNALARLDDEQLLDLLFAFQACQRHNYVHPCMWGHFARVLSLVERRSGVAEDEIQTSWGPAGEAL